MKVKTSKLGDITPNKKLLPQFHTYLYSWFLHPPKDVSLGNYATTKGRHNIHITTDYQSLLQFFKFNMIEFQKINKKLIKNDGLHGIYLKQQVRVKPLKFR